MSASDHLSTGQFFSKPMGANPRVAYNAINGYHATVTRKVAISSITPTQEDVYKPGVDGYASGSQDEHGPVRLYQGGKRTVWDGHHRIAAAVQRGETHINAEIYRSPYSTAKRKP